MAGFELKNQSIFRNNAAHQMRAPAGRETRRNFGQKCNMSAAQQMDLWSGPRLKAIAHEFAPVPVARFASAQRLGLDRLVCRICSAKFALTATVAKAGPPEKASINLLAHKFQSETFSHPRRKRGMSLCPVCASLSPPPPNLDTRATGHVRFLSFAMPETADPESSPARLEGREKRCPKLADF